MENRTTNELYKYQTTKGSQKEFTYVKQPAINKIIRIKKFKRLDKLQKNKNLQKMDRDHTWDSWGHE